MNTISGISVGRAWFDEETPFLQGWPRENIVYLIKLHVLNIPVVGSFLSLDAVVSWLEFFKKHKEQKNMYYNKNKTEKYINARD